MKNFDVHLDINRLCFFKLILLSLSLSVLPFRTELIRQYFQTHEHFCFVSFGFCWYEVGSDVPSDDLQAFI